MVQHVRHHKDTKSIDRKETVGSSKPAEAMLDGYQRVQAITDLVESSIVWRANLMAWSGQMDKAEELLFRLVFKEGARTPAAMNLLARIWFQQGKTSQALDIFRQASAAQPGNPALRRCVARAQVAMGSANRTLLQHRMRIVSCFMLILLMVSGVIYGGVKAKQGFDRWLAGPELPVAEQPLMGKFVFDPGSIVDDTFGDYASYASYGNDGKYPVGFARKRMGTGTSLGRVEVMVEQKDGNIRVSGVVPSLYVRFMVEQAMWEIPGASNVDLRDLEVERTYTVAKGDNLWMISKRVFGEGQSWTMLSKYNGIKDPSKLKVGQTLDLPLGNEELVRE